MLVVDEVDGPNSGRPLLVFQSKPGLPDVVLAFVEEVPVPGAKGRPVFQSEPGWEPEPVGAASGVAKMERGD